MPPAARRKKRGSWTSLKNAACDGRFGSTTRGRCRHATNMLRMSNSAIIWTVAGILAVPIFALGVKLSDSQWLLGLTCCAVSSFIVFGAGLLWISLEKDIVPQHRILLGVVGAFFGVMIALLLGEIIRPVPPIKENSRNNSTLTTSRQTLIVETSNPTAPPKTLPKEDGAPSSPQEHMSHEQSGVIPTVQSGTRSSGGLSRDEITTRIDLWRSIDLQLNRFMFAVNSGYAVYSDWAQHVKSNKQDIMSKLAQLKGDLQQPVADIGSLENSYPDYGELRGLLERAGGNGNFTFVSIQGFYQEIASLPSPIPDEYENSIKPYANAFKRDLDLTRDWINANQKIAASKVTELADMSPK